MSDLGATVSSLPRAAILQAAESERLQHLVQRHGRRLGAGRFVAGETLDECVRVLRRLNDTGLYANTTLLGEAIPDEAGAAAVTDEYERIAARLVAEELRANVALKLTHLGLSFDEETAYENVARLVARVGELGTFVRIDMEQSDYVDGTLRIYERLRAAGLDSVGTVLQAYLYRTPDDLQRLLPLRPNLRIVKGAYLEPRVDRVPREARRRPQRTYSSSSAACARAPTSRSRRTTSGSSATCREFVAREDISHDRFEFQMLYGVRPALQRSIAADGYKVLVAAPYGPDWYPYFMRRLAERPANVAFFLRNLVRR